VGESVTEALLAQWYKSDGDYVRKDEPLFVIETDKVTLEVTAEADGVLHIAVDAGRTVKIDAVVGTIDTESKAEGAPSDREEKKKAPPVVEASEKSAGKEGEAKPEAQKGGEEKAESKERAETEAEEDKSERAPAEKKTEKEPAQTAPENGRLSPSVKKLLEKNGLEAGDITGTGPAGRITRGDVLLHLEQNEKVAQKDEPFAHPSKPAAAAEPQQKKGDAGEPVEKVTREPMSPLRRRIAEHLLKAKQNTAMLTTFNDIDMQNVMQLRSRYKEAFKSKYDVSLGFMSFFIKAGIEALKAFPRVNAFIEEGQIVYHHYFHIGVAIGTGKGLVVPVIRHADQLSFAELEQAIVDFVDKVKNNRLELADLEGGTFTITNGGVFGSLLSTPILNMPQSGILGMHRIEKRPVVVDDQVVIRPMMYVALSYDHRIVDGREAVTFLRRIKECVENPERMLMEI
jgi:2-oxoglutarate dehydrogenase E2 component (dihydrolipoamide succinyltransferase)